MSKRPHRPNPDGKSPPRKLIPDARESWPKPPNDSKMARVYIAPTLAKEWLLRNTRNRPPSSVKVEAIVRSLTHSLFHLNGETIKFDEEGVLRDGQTRLQAIVESGVAAWCWVCYDLPASTFETIDLTRARSLHQFLAIRKHKNYTSLAHAIREVYNLNGAAVKERGGFAPQVGLELLECHPGIEESLDYIFAIGANEVYSSGSAAALHWLMKQKDADLADRYWAEIATGVIGNRRSPTLCVRTILTHNKQLPTRQRQTATTLMAIAIKGWNLLRRGATCKYVRWQDGEKFPQIE